MNTFKKRMKHFISLMLCSFLLFSIIAPCIAQSTDIPERIITYRSIDYSRYNSIMDELASISADISHSESGIAKLSANKLSELNERQNALYNELEDMGAVLSKSLLEQLPAPSSNISGASSPYAMTPTPLTGSLADLAEYYDNWFYFTGYEENVVSSGQTYRVCLVELRTKGSSILNNNYALTDIINSSADLNGSFTSLAQSGLKLTYQKVLDTTSWKPIKVWAVGQFFNTLINQINSGTVIVDQNGVSYRYGIHLETNLYYVYVWNDTTNEWNYCLSSSKVYVDESHGLYYNEYVGGSGSQFAERKIEPDEPIEYSLQEYSMSELGALAAAWYASNGNTPPTVYPTYQVGSIQLQRRLGSSGTFQTECLFQPIFCSMPGDLWHLGSALSS